jgi:protein phosphatase
VGAFTDVGRARERNEDAYLSSPPLYAVADGLGGHRGGNVASTLALRVLARIARPGMWERLTEQIREANRAILEQARGDRTLSGMGTTLTAAFMDGDELHLAHVGDSRAYLLRSGEFSPLTEDHTLVHRMVREGKISPEEAEYHPQRNIVVRALGVEEPVEVDEITVEVHEGDRVLLCSDGLYSMVPDERIRDALASTRDPQEACARLVGMANDAGGLDNITVVILDFEEGDGAEVLAPDPGISKEDAGAPVQPVQGGPGPSGAAPGEADRLDPASTGTATSIATAPEGRPAPEPATAEPRPRRRRRRFALWTVAAVAVLALAFAGFRSFLDSRWFVGTKAGHVAVFRGIPTRLFGTVNLYGLVREYPDLSAPRAERLAAYSDLSDGHTVDTEGAAFRIVNAIRRQLAEQSRSGPSP